MWLGVLEAVVWLLISISQHKRQFRLLTLVYANELFEIYVLMRRQFGGQLGKSVKSGSSLVALVLRYLSILGKTFPSLRFLRFLM